MIDKEEIRRWWDVFVGDGGFTEIRILGRFQYSGYFRDVEHLIETIGQYLDVPDEQAYFVLNDIDPSCYGRQQCEKFVKTPKITTNDGDIIHRKWVLCDFDPVRKSGTNSSDEQLEMARAKAGDVFRFLKERGFEDPVVCRSGNGYHNLYRIDVPADDDSTEVIKGFFKYMGSMFSDDKVEFDEKNFNASRICKLYGTVAKKGANIPEMPWRMAEIAYVPKEVKATPLDKFRELAMLAPKDEPARAQRPSRQSGRSFDLQSWLDDHGIVYKVDKQGTSTRYTLEYCPWVDTHSDRKKWDSALFVDPDGKITFNCQHAHCKDKTWQDVRLFYEPDAYDRRYEPQPRHAQRRKHYEIKAETPELGKKWKTMKSIEKLDLDSLEGVKTGCMELDRNIMQLNYGEVSLLSGGNASGKSTYLNTLLLNIVDQGVPCALWSGEVPERVLKAWIQMAAAGRSNLRGSKFSDKYFVPNNIGERIDEWMEDMFYIYNTEYGNTWEQIFNDMEELLELGVKVFILDNLFSLDIDLLEGDRNNKQKELIIQIKEFAKKNNVHIILVAHPRKTMAFLRKNDIAGTGDLTNAVDNVFIMHRVNNDFFRAGAEFFGQAEIQRFQGFGNVIEVAKNRMYGVCDLMVGLYYEMESRRFKNTPDENAAYGWQRPQTQSHLDVGTDDTYDSNLPFSRQTEDDVPF